MPAQKLRHGRKEYGVEDEAGNWLIEPSATTKGATRVAAARFAERRGESVYVIEVGEDRDGGSRIVVDREEIRPPAEPPRSRAQIKRDIDEVLARKPGNVQGHQGSAKAQPYEGMPVSATKIGAARHGLRVGSQGIIKRVASADRSAMKKRKQSGFFKRWLSHVKATPPGMIPVLLNGTVPAWNVASGPMKEIRSYLSSVAPRTAWPKWALTG